MEHEEPKHIETEDLYQKLIFLLSYARKNNSSGEETLLILVDVLKLDAEYLNKCVGRYEEIRDEQTKLDQLFEGVNLDAKEETI
jgi:hypothetical protein